jgi:hypothetical protein
MGELKKVHTEARDRAKYYINTLQETNEILFLSILNKSGFVW